MFLPPSMGLSDLTMVIGGIFDLIPYRYVLRLKGYEQDIEVPHKTYLWDIYPLEWDMSFITEGS